MSATITVGQDPPRAEILRLLSAAGLPTADVGASAQQTFFGVRDGADRAAWLGVVGVERHGDEALLRSLTVSPDARGQGLGAKLVATVELFARARGCRRVILLTTDAQAYFARLGFSPVARESLSKALAGSSQVVSICPASAIVMAKNLPR